MTIPYILGYSRKNPNRGGWGCTSLKSPTEFLDLPCYPWPMEIPNEFFLNTPGNPTSFLIDPWNFDMLFLQYPWIFHVLNHPQPPCLDFFWNSPFIDPVFKCFAYSWFVQNSQGTVHVISASRNAAHDLILKKKTMVPFYGWDSTCSRLVPLQGDSLLFTTKFPEVLGTHFIDLGRMKGCVNLGATQWLWTQDPWIGNPVP